MKEKYCTTSKGKVCGHVGLSKMNHFTLHAFKKVKIKHTFHLLLFSGSWFLFIYLRPPSNNSAESYFLQFACYISSYKRLDGDRVARCFLVGHFSLGLQNSTSAPAWWCLAIWTTCTQSSTAFSSRVLLQAVRAAWLLFLMGPWPVYYTHWICIYL